MTRTHPHHPAAPEVIASRANELVKFARAVRDGRDRSHIFIEGVRLCEEAAAAPRLIVTDALYSRRLAESERGARLLARLAARGGVRMREATEDVVGYVADTKTSQGVILLASRPPSGIETLSAAQSSSTPTSSAPSAPLLAVLHGVTNPANAGAILRAAEAAGATGAVALAGTCDLYSPKALRGAMGSAFRLPLWTDASAEEAASCCSAGGIEPYLLDARAALTHTEVDWARPSAIVLGAEGAGLAGGARLAGTPLRIPMNPAVESLNVAVALAVVLYEAARQRGFRF